MRPKKNIIFLAALLCIFPPLSAVNSNFSVKAIKTATPPVIDGKLAEKIWEEAPLLSDYTQFEPHKGDPASVKTVVRILYDEKYIYFGFTCYDPEPDKIVLGTRRDGLMMGVDSACVTMDTFFDKRTAYYFRTNPLGVQHDGRVSENGRVADLTWDGTWESAGAMIPEGWSAEMAIPLSTVKYKPGNNQTWGLQSSRYFPRNIEKSFWSGPLEDYRKMDGHGTLTGLDLKGSGHRLEVIPHVISQLQEGEKTDLEVGLDARYDFTPSISGHLTLNPDFATVEADQERVNLTRFELNMPEKRNFFLEGNDIYQQRIRLFYSRRIADICGGAKVYGKVGGNEIVLLTAQTKESENGGNSANFTVFRFKRDVMKNSTVGLLAANKLVNGKNQGTVGLDTSLFFTKTFKFTGQLALSYGDGNKSDLAFFLRPSYDSSTFHIHCRYNYLGMYFGDNANAVGFIRDDNRHELDSAISKIFWLKSWGLDRITYSSNYNIYWGMDKVLRSWDVYQSLTFDLQNKFSLKVLNDQEYKLYEKEFRNYSTLLELGYNTREWQSVKASYQFGKNYDLDFSLIGGSVRQKITQGLSAEYSLTKLYLSPDPENESTWIHALWATQYFTKDLFLKLFFQTNSAIEKQNIQVVFSYRFQPPFGLIQLAYQKGTARFGEKGNQGHTLFIKFSYVF